MSGEALDLSVTTCQGMKGVRLFKMGVADTNATDGQVDGRIRRPLAQEHVKAWFIHTVVATRSRDDGEPDKTIDGALQKILRMREEQKNAADGFARGMAEGQDFDEADQEFEREAGADDAVPEGDARASSFMKILAELSDLYYDEEVARKKGKEP